MEIIDKVDETIVYISEILKGESYKGDYYAETVKALAELLEARAKYTNQSIFLPEETTGNYCNNSGCSTGIC